MLRLDIRWLERAAPARAEVVWGRTGTPWGEAVVALYEERLCALAPVRTVVEEARARIDLAKRWRGFAFSSAERAVLERWSARLHRSRETLPVTLRGTPFQHAVWKALLDVPAGSSTTYGALAEAIGNPAASRAVGAAVGQNPLAVLVPCHRVLPKGGGTGGYHWGVARKEELLERERAAA